MSAVEVRQILTELSGGNLNDRRMAAIVTFLYDTGMRTGELAGLFLGDVSFRTGEIYVTGKGEKGREVVAGKLALRSVRCYLEVRREGLARNGDRLFTKSNGSPMTSDGIAHIFRRLRDDQSGPVVHRRVPDLQHDIEPDDAGGASRVLSQRSDSSSSRQLRGLWLVSQGKRTGHQEDE